MKPVRIHRKRTKGWRKPNNTVNVARPSKWANTFDWREEENIIRLEESKNLGTNYTEKQIRLLAKLRVANKFASSLSQDYKDLAKEELRGKNLMCWCKENEPCHGSILIRLANS